VKIPQNTGLGPQAILGASTASRAMMTMAVK